MMPSGPVSEKWYSLSAVTLKIFSRKRSQPFAGKIEVDYAFQSLDDLPEGFSVPEGRGKALGHRPRLRAARHVVKEPLP